MHEEFCTVVFSKIAKVVAISNAWGLVKYVNVITLALFLHKERNIKKWEMNLQRRTSNLRGRTNSCMRRLKMSSGLGILG